MCCTSNDLNKLTNNTYFLDHYKKKHIVFGCLLQNTIRGCINIQEFASSPDSNTLDLNFLPYNAKVLACSEQGIMVFNSPNPSLLISIIRDRLLVFCKLRIRSFTALIVLKSSIQTNRGSIYMLLTNGDILRVDAYSATWEILTPPVPTLKCDQAAILKQQVKYSEKLGFAFKPPNGCWEIWVLNIDHSWEKVYVFTVNQDIGNKPIKVGLYDADIRVMVDHGTIIPYIFKGGVTDHSSQIFCFRSDFEPTDLMVG
nr:hypothetical protein [Tanacetum cinerariifolium]